MMQLQDAWSAFANTSSAEPHEIIPSLYLSSRAPPSDESVLQTLKITHILTAAKELTPHFIGKYHYMQLNVQDWDRQNILQYLSLTNEWIHSALAGGGKVLVHCFAGISRSATIVISYVMKELNLSYEAAYNKVKGIRPVVSPNDSFSRQLLLFERLHFGVKIAGETTDDVVERSLAGVQVCADDHEDWDREICISLFKLEFAGKLEKNTSFTSKNSGWDPKDFLNPQIMQNMAQTFAEKPNAQFFSITDPNHVNTSMGALTVKDYASASPSPSTAAGSVESIKQLPQDKLSPEEIQKRMEMFKREFGRLYVWVCKKCRRYLFTALNIKHGSQAAFEIEHMMWMKGIVQYTGPLHCCDCQAEIGFYDWKYKNPNDGSERQLFVVQRSAIEKEQFQVPDGLEYGDVSLKPKPPPMQGFAWIDHDDE